MRVPSGSPITANNHREALVRKDLNWSVTDPRLYNGAFTGRAKAIPCCQCLSENHSGLYCPVNPTPPLVRWFPQFQQLHPDTQHLGRGSTPQQEICQNFHDNQCQYKQVPAFARYICHGLSHSFRISFDRNSPLKSALSNMESTTQHPVVICNYLNKELSLGQMFEPFPELSSLPHLYINHFRDNSQGPQHQKWRLITDLSISPGQSVNNGINPSLCSLCTPRWTRWRRFWLFMALVHCWPTLILKQPTGSSNSTLRIIPYKPR